jgi:hypothetical protein
MLVSLVITAPLIAGLVPHWGRGAAETLSPCKK